MASTKISFTPSGAGNLNKWTISLWLKRAKVGVEQVIASCYENSNYQTQIKFESDDQLYFNDENNGYTNGRIVSNAKFLDTNAWYHMVFIWDKDNGTSDDKIRMYVNGERVTSFSDTGNAPSASSTWNVNGQAMQFGAKVTSDYFDGAMSHIHFCDGYAYEPTEFGETDSVTGEWKIKTSPSVSYGTNGYFWLANNVATTDNSPNSNTFTASGTLTKTEDNPSNIFCTFNPNMPMGGDCSFENANTSFKCSTSNWRMFMGNLGITKGKYYWEFKPTVHSGGDFPQIGIVSVDAFDADDYIGNESSGYAYMHDGRKNVPAGASSYGDTWTTNDIISVAFDMDNLKLYFAKNGVWQDSGDPTSGSTGTGAISVSSSFSCFAPAGSVYEGSGGAPIYQFNFGNGYFGTTQVSSAQSPDDGTGIFEHDVPASYKALTTKGLNT